MRRFYLEGRLPKKIKEKYKKEDIKHLNSYPNSLVRWNVVGQYGYDYFKLPVTRDFVDYDNPHRDDEIIKLCLEKFYELFVNLKKRFCYLCWFSLFMVGNQNSVSFFA